MQPSSNKRGLRAAIASYAQQFVGCPYVYGGVDPEQGTDCSGLIQYIYKQYGIEIPRTAEEQAESGTKVSLDALQPGDVVFYGSSKITHVAMYVGGGKAIEAMNEEKGVACNELRLENAAWGVSFLPE